MQRINPECIFQKKKNSNIGMSNSRNYQRGRNQGRRFEQRDRYPNNDSPSPPRQYNYRPERRRSPRDHSFDRQYHEYSPARRHDNSQDRPRHERQYSNEGDQFNRNSPPYRHEQDNRSRSPTIRSRKYGNEAYSFYRDEQPAKKDNFQMESENRARIDHWNAHAERQRIERANVQTELAHIRRRQVERRHNQFKCPNCNHDLKEYGAQNVAPWFEYEKIEMGNHYFDFFPPRSYRKSKDCIPWWHQDCLNCFRNNHIACICDQPDREKKCCYCKGIGHYISECPFRLLAEEMVEARKKYPSNTLPDRVLNEFYNRAQVFVKHSQRSNIKRGAANRSSELTRDEPRNMPTTETRYQYEERYRYSSRQAAEPKQRKIGNDHTAYEYVLNDDERTWHTELLPSHPHFYLVHPNRQRRPPSTTGIRNERPVLPNDVKSKPRREQDRDVNQPGTSTGGHTKFGRNANSIRHGPTDPWNDNSHPIPRQTTTQPVRPCTPEADWTNEVDLMNKPEDMAVDTIITSGVFNTNTVNLTETAFNTVSNTPDITPGNLQIELPNWGPLRNRVSPNESQTTTELNTSATSQETLRPPSTLSRFNDIAAEINQLDLQKINLQELPEYATFVERMHQCVSRIHAHIQPTLVNIVDTPAEEVNADRSITRTDPNENRNGTAVDVDQTPRTARRLRSNNPRQHKCVALNCDRVFQTSADLKRHEAVHTGKKPFKCLASNCNKRFSQRCNMVKHMSTCQKRRREAIGLAKLTNSLEILKQEIVKPEAVDKSTADNPDENSLSSSDEAN